MSQSLFSSNVEGSAPLAEKLRPTALDTFVGQTDLVGEGSLLREALDRDDIPSMIFWGPPGCGKTTLATIIAQMTSSEFVQLSAVSSGKKDLQKVIEQAQQTLEFERRRTILFVDEIHRWNKAQQDALLPVVEKGALILIGATTENPSFEVNSALLSRCQVFVFKQLSVDDIIGVLKEGVEKLKAEASKEVLQYIAELSNGDARSAINTLEFAHQPGKPITKERIKEVVEKTFKYDKHGEEHFNVISALHKTMRASDPDAAVYWLTRMLESGEDPLYIARRVLRFASEDVGNAKPTALVVANAAFETCQKLGMPECALALVQAVDYCARAPKSRALDDAYNNARRAVREHPNAPVPMHLRNAPTKLMKELGYGKREQESNLPENLIGETFFD